MRKMPKTLRKTQLMHRRESTAKDDLQDRLDNLTDIVIPPVTDTLAPDAPVIDSFDGQQ